MNNVGFLFSLYESSTGECIATTSVSGKKMAPVLKAITQIVKTHESNFGEGNVLIKTLKVRLNEDQIITDPRKMDNISTMLALVTEHYNHVEADVLVETCITKKKNVVLENLKKILSSPEKLEKLKEAINTLKEWKIGDAVQHVDASHIRGKIKRFTGDGHVQLDKPFKIPVDKLTKQTRTKAGAKAANWKDKTPAMPNSRGEFKVNELELPSLEKGDVLLVGKFKNRRAEITGFETDENGQPIAKTTKGDQKIFKPRVAKLIPVK